jgi:flagellar M-ring protein FliF
LDKFLSAIQRFGVGRLAALIGVAAGAIAVIAAVMMMMSKQPNELLLSNVDPKESAAATQALDTAGIKYETKSDGSTIYVARDKVNSARQLIFTKGLVTSGSVGYEIFDTSSALGQTDFVQQLNRQRALQGELERTIQGWDGVRAARVHLVIPKRQLFEEDAEKPTAAVTISTGREPSADMVRAVQNLVAGSVAGMKPDAVNVIDQHGKTLSAGNDESLAGKLAQDAKSEAEARIAKTVKDMLDGVLGPGKARVNVNANLDLNRVTVQERKFDPDGQVIRSESTNANNASETKNDDTGGVTSTQNIPGQTPNGFQPLGSKQDSNESVTNYEISESTKTTVQEPGSVIRQAVSVAIDGITAPPGKDGKPGAYTPRTAAEMAQLEQLVKTAVGFDAGPRRPGLGGQCPLPAARGPGPGQGRPDGRHGQERPDALRRAGRAGRRRPADPAVRGPSVPEEPDEPAADPAGPGAEHPQVTRMVTLSDGSTQEVIVDQSGEPIAIAGPRATWTSASTSPRSKAR